MATQPEPIPQLLPTDEDDPRVGLSAEERAGPRRRSWMGALAIGIAACSQSVGPGDGSADGAIADACVDAAAAPAPRPLYPPAGSIFTSRSVHFRWASGAGPWRVVVCRDRACASSVATALSPTSDVTVPNLPAGLLFWQVVSARCDAASSAVWPLYVSNRTAPHGAAWGAPLDLDGDGFADLAVAERDTGRVWIYAGGPRGLDTASVADTPATVGALVGVASLGDLDGDGVGELGIAEQNGVHIYRGVVGAIPRVESQFVASPSGPMTYAAAAGGGDVNGDGYADLVMGSAAPAPGQAWVYFGTARGVPSVPDRTIAPPSGLVNFGAMVSGAGDVTASGYSDFLVGAQTTSGAGGTADTVLFLGGMTGADPTRVVVLPPSALPACCGVAVAAGDVDGDGFPDVFYDSNDPGVSIYAGGVSAPLTRIAQLSPGQDPLLAASDTDGDGFDDVLITYATGPLPVDTPRTFTAALYGGPAGTNTWSSPSTGSGGLALASGDYNGDGYGDAAVGFAETNEVLVFYGSATGLPRMPSLTIRSDRGGGFGGLLAN